MAAEPYIRTVTAARNKRADVPSLPRRGLGSFFARGGFPQNIISKGMVDYEKQQTHHL